MILFNLLNNVQDFAAKKQTLQVEWIQSCLRTRQIAAKLPKKDALPNLCLFFHITDSVIWYVKYSQRGAAIQIVDNLHKLMYLQIATRNLQCVQGGVATQIRTNAIDDIIVVQVHGLESKAGELITIRF